MRELYFIADRLEDINRELSISNYTGFLEESTKKVRKIVEPDTFYVDVFMHSAATSKASQFMIDLNENMNGITRYDLSLKNEIKVDVRVFNQVLTSVAIVLFDETLNNAYDFKQSIVSLTERYKLIIIVDFYQDEACEQFKSAFNYKVNTVIVKGEELAGKNIEEFLKSIFPDFEKLNKLNRLTYVNSVKPLFTVLDDIFASENKAIQTRKLLNTQNMQITRKEEQGLNISDFMNNIRQIIQKFGQDADKNFRIKYEDLNKPNTGQFSQISQTQVNSLTDFERELMAEKSERVAVRVSKDYQEKVVKSISKTIRGELSKDDEYLKITFDDVLSQINMQLKQKNIVPIKIEDVFIPLPESKRVIGSYCYMSKQYNGEIIKKGPTEYFVALRDYIGVIMVATGLLAPLNMIASLQDEHSFLKQMNVGIKYTTAFITLGLIIYGIFDLQKRIPRKREEEFARELTKAKEVLMQETKRMFSESTRDWMTSLTAWIRDITQNINNQVDKNIKDRQNTAMQQMGQEKNQQIRLQQSIDTIQRNIQSAERIKDQLTVKFKEIILETERDLKF